LSDTFVLLRMDIKNRETFNRQIFKRGEEGAFCGVHLYFSCEPVTKHFTAHILSHINNICHLFVFLALQPIVVVFSQPGSGL